MYIRVGVHIILCVRQIWHLLILSLCSHEKVLSLVTFLNLALLYGDSPFNGLQGQRSCFNVHIVGVMHITWPKEFNFLSCNTINMSFLAKLYFEAAQLYVFYMQDV